MMPHSDPRKGKNGGRPDEQAEVKEEQEEEEPNEELPTMQIRAPDWFYSFLCLEHDPDARPNEDPLTRVKSEIWTMRANLETQGPD